MDVFVIPLGPERYELYCEQPLPGDAAPTAPPRGLFDRLKARLVALIRKAEDVHRNGPREPAAGWFARLNDRALALVAERVAEQRLLWAVRNVSGATIVHPDDLTFAQARTLVERTFQRDLERHERWLWIDGGLFLLTFIALSPIFILIPGVANLPAIYFGFQTVGHWYSKRGARHGLTAVAWSGAASAPLTDLRAAATLPITAREDCVKDIADQLRLEHLPKFYERVSIAV